MTVQLHDLSLDMILIADIIRSMCVHSVMDRSHKPLLAKPISLFQLSPTPTLHNTTFKRFTVKIDSITQTCFTTTRHFRLTQKWLNLQCKNPCLLFSVLFQVLSLAHFADRHQSDLWSQTTWGEREQQRSNWKPRITSVCVRTALWEVGLGEKYYATKWLHLKG